MVYAEFQKLSTGWNGTDFTGPKTPIPMLGSDGVYILDGRNNRARQIADAHKRVAALSKLHPYIIGFIIHEGRSFTDSKPKTEMIPCQTPTPSPS